MPKKLTSKVSRAKRGARKASALTPAMRDMEQMIDRVSGLMARHNLAELEWADGRGRLRLSKFGAHGAAAAAFHHVPAPSVPVHAEKTPSSQPATAEPKIAAKSAPESNQKKILAPFVGTFYRAPTPGASPYVKDGQLVKKGDVMCIIEAMKLMNELESDHTGKILSILVENGQPVEFGEPLFVIET